MIPHQPLSIEDLTSSPDDGDVACERMVRQRWFAIDERLVFEAVLSLGDGETRKHGIVGLPAETQFVRAVREGAKGMFKVYVHNYAWPEVGEHSIPEITVVVQQA